MDNGHITRLLKNHNIRITQIRKEIISIFTSYDRALSHADIEAAIVDCDRITLYRNLKTFQSKGLIHLAVDGTNVPKYAMCPAHCNEVAHVHNHIHFHCDQCESTFCLEQDQIPNIPTPEGFKITSADLVLNGQCKKCNDS